VTSNTTLIPARDCLHMPLNMELPFAHSNVAAVEGAWPVMGFTSHQQIHGGPPGRIVGCSHFSRGEKKTTPPPEARKKTVSVVMARDFRYKTKHLRAPYTTRTHSIRFDCAIGSEVATSATKPSPSLRAPSPESTCREQLKKHLVPARGAEGAWV
jgi:hypothetical protein